jgi:hypothetical protein
LLSPLTPLLCSRASPLPQPSLSSGPTLAQHRSVSRAPLSRGYRQVGGTSHPHLRSRQAGPELGSEPHGPRVDSWPARQGGRSLGL